MVKNICIAMLLALAHQASASQDLQHRVDLTHDTSRALQGYREGSWMAVPIPISNPTIGNGLQGALLYLHGKSLTEEESPNATSGLGAMYTDTETWAVGAFHDDYLFQDRLRVRAALGTGKVNLDYYGNDSRFNDRPVGFSVEGDVGLLQMLGQVPGTEGWYMGTKALYLGSEVAFDYTEFFDFLPEFGFPLDLVTLSLLLSYDSRDDNYYPSNGQHFEVSGGRDDARWGSDAEYNRYKVVYSHYFSFNERNIAAANINAEQVDGDAPFFLLPSLNMRGFATNKYQGDAAASAHFEWRYKFHERWGIMLSYEFGAVGERIDELGNYELITSVGAGVRWQVQPTQKLNLGIDVGLSGDDSAFYIVVGEKF